MKQLGLKLPRETMANWYIYCAEHYLLPVYERMHELMLMRDILCADETTCQVLREEGERTESTSYMWTYLTGNDGLSPIILYDYVKLLDVNSEEDIPEPVLPSEKELETMLPAQVGLLYCNCLFYIERHLRGLMPKRRKKMRQEKETPIWEAFWKWLFGLNAVGGGGGRTAGKPCVTICWMADVRFPNNAVGMLRKKLCHWKKKFLVPYINEWDEGKCHHV